MPFDQDRKAEDKGENSNAWCRKEEGVNYITELARRMELPEEKSWRECTEICNRQGHDGGCQNSQGHREVDRRSAIHALDTHNSTNVAPGAKKSGSKEKRDNSRHPAIQVQCSYAAMSGFGWGATQPCGFSA
jgi:hypothetical protein